MLLRNQVEKGAVLENLDLDLLCLGETLDEGCVTQFLHPGYEVCSYSRATEACCQALRSSITHYYR